jgi:DNA-binding NtrC family response regulator
VEEGALREDLYYRLAQFPIRIPPLRERGDDITLLANIFLAELNESNGVAKAFSPEALELLRLYSWPGNVRELRNAVARAHVLAADTIEPDDLPPRVVDGGPVARDYLRISVGQPLAEVERRAILATVEHFGGDKKAAAQALGVSLKTLYTKLKKYRAR